LGTIVSSRNLTKNNKRNILIVLSKKMRKTIRVGMECTFIMKNRKAQTIDKVDCPNKKWWTHTRRIPKNKVSFSMLTQGLSRRRQVINHCSIKVT
jgi:hypothetical protein